MFSLCAACCRFTDVEPLSNSFYNCYAPGLHLICGAAAGSQVLRRRASLSAPATADKPLAPPGSASARLLRGQSLRRQLTSGRSLVVPLVPPPAVRFQRGGGEEGTRTVRLACEFEAGGPDVVQVGGRRVASVVTGSVRTGSGAGPYQ